MKVSGIKTLGLVTFLFASVAVSGSFAATLTVTTVSDTVDGVCDADCSLREAVMAATSDDVIFFSPLFNTPQTITLTNGQMLINKNLTINGPGASLLAVSGNNAGRIFRISGGAAVLLTGMTLRDGRVGIPPNDQDPYGGAVIVGDSSLILVNMTLVNNSIRPPVAGVPGLGGAVAGFSSNISVIDSNISNSSNEVDRGAALFLTIGSLTVTNSTINNNAGGGITVFAPLLNVVDSTINGNSGYAVNGGSAERFFITRSRLTNNGGGVLSSSQSLTIDGSVISGNNSSLNGVIGCGVINLNQGNAVITNSSVNNNRGLNKGGGVINTGTMNIVNSAITNNLAFESGGGIYNVIGRLFLTNSTVSGNVAFAGVGGGIHNGSAEGEGRVVLTNSTITNNRATGNGGGLAHNSAGSATIRSTIIAGNLSNTGNIDFFGTIVSQGFNLIGNTAGSTAWIESDLLNQNPLLGPLANNGGWTLTHALLSDSPAIDKGSSGGLTTDQRERTRPFDNPGVPNAAGGDGADIGSFEVQASLTVEISGRVLTPFGHGLRNAIVVLVDSQNNRRTASTSSFGFYSFADVPTGALYVIGVSSRRYRFASQSITPVESHQNIDFVGQILQA